MPTVKEQMTKIIQELPDDSSYDEILRELVRLRRTRMIEKGLADSLENQTISNEEMKRRIRTWQKQIGQPKPNDSSGKSMNI